MIEKCKNFWAKYAELISLSLIKGGAIHNNGWINA